MRPYRGVRSGRPFLRRWLGAFGAGVLLVVCYHLLVAYDIGKIGKPTDIGGGFILLLGYLLAVVGAVGAGMVLVSDRRSRHGGRS